MPKILIAQEDSTELNALKIKFEKEGYEVVAARDGEETLDKMRLKPDALVLDLKLPKKSGIEVLKKLQTQSEAKLIPIIILSDSGNLTEIEEALALGAKDFIIKTEFTAQNVLERLTPHLSAHPRSQRRDFNDRENRFHKSILIVEDDDFLRRLLTDKLKKEGFEVTEAAGGEEALQSLKKQVPMLVLLDLVMPGTDGFHVLQAIRQNSITKNIPVVVLSNLGEDADISRAKSLGADDYMIKAHFVLDEIVKKVSQVIEKRYL